MYSINFTNILLHIFSDRARKQFKTENESRNGYADETMKIF